MIPMNPLTPLAQGAEGAQSIAGKAQTPDQDSLLAFRAAWLQGQDTDQDSAAGESEFPTDAAQRDASDPQTANSVEVQIADQDPLATAEGEAEAVPFAMSPEESQPKPVQALGPAPDGRTNGTGAVRPVPPEILLTTQRAVQQANPQEAVPDAAPQTNSTTATVPAEPGQTRGTQGLEIPALSKGSLPAGPAKAGEARQRLEAVFQADTDATETRPGVAQPPASQQIQTASQALAVADMAGLRQAALRSADQVAEHSAESRGGDEVDLSAMLRRATDMRFEGGGASTPSTGSGPASTAMQQPLVGPSVATIPYREVGLSDLSGDMKVEITAGTLSFADTARADGTRALPVAQLPAAILAKLREMIATPGQPTAPGRTEVTLAPAELGRVTFVIGQEDGLLSLQVLAERPETLDLIRRHADLLHRTASDGPVKLTLGQSGNQADDAPARDGDPQANGPSPQEGPDPINASDTTPGPTNARLVSTERLLDLRL